MSTALRLAAADADDLVVIAACLQDALVLVDDMVYEPETGRFVLVASRFRWEEGGSPARTTAGLTVAQVTGAKRRHLERRHGDRILSLLTLTAEPGGIRLVFSGGAEIRLETEAIDVRLQDLGEAWPATGRPSHDGA